MTEHRTSDGSGLEFGGQRPFSAAILNGGMASRYGGADKQSLPIGSVAIGTILASTLREEAKELFIIGRPHSMYDGIADGQYVDALKGRGPLEGLHIAMRYASYPWILLCAADMPFVSPFLIRRLFEIAVHGESEIVLSEFNGVYQPFSAFYRRDLMDVLAARIESQSSLSLWKFLQTRRFEVLPSTELATICDAEFVFQNINDPTSYAEAREAARRRGFTSEARV